MAPHKVWKAKNDNFVALYVVEARAAEAIRHLPGGHPPIKTTLAWFSEPMASCFVRMPYVVFAFPLAMTELGSKEPEVALRAGGA